MRLNFKVGVEGRFSFAKKANKSAKEIKCFDKPSKNLILDSFLNSVNGNPTNLLTGGLNSVSLGAIGMYCAVGTATTPPANSDTGLGNQVMSQSASGITDDSSYVQYDSENDLFELHLKRRIEFAPATVSNILSEVLIGTGPTNNLNTPFVSKALIKDGSGSPTTLPIAVGEILVVYYELIAYVPAEISGSFTIDGVLTNVNGYIWATDFAPLSWSIPVKAATTSYFPSGNTTGGSRYYKSAIQTKPTYPASTSISGWTTVSSGNLSSVTPLNSASVMKLRTRYGLSLLNAHAIGSLSTSSFGIGAGGIGFVVTFNPAISSKTNSKVFEIEGFIEMVRV